MTYEAQNADLVPMPNPRGAYAAQVDILRAAVWRAMGEISNDGADAAYETLAAAYALSERPNARDHEASGGSLTLDDRIDGAYDRIADVQDEIMEKLGLLAGKVLKLEDFSGIGVDTRGQDVLMKASDVTLTHRFDAVYSCMDEIENAVCSQKQDIASLDARLSALEVALKEIPHV